MAFIEWKLFNKLILYKHGCPPHLIDRFTYYDLTWLTLPRYVVSLKLPMPFYKHVGFMKWLGISPLGCFKGVILMVFTKKGGIFMGYVSFREGINLGFFWV